MDFESIDYLKSGTPLQKEAYEALSENNVMEKLGKFQPLLVGTIPINIAIKDSDLDIVCTFEKKEIFIKEIQQHFSAYLQFSIIEKIFSGEPTVIVRFKLVDFLVEIFAQNKPSNQQLAYQHMMVEHQILLDYGEEFRKEIIRLKELGIKTEPAFAQLLNLKGDSYQALLDYGMLRKII